MPDIVTTWSDERGEFWDYKVTDEEIESEWDPWEFKARLPEIHLKNKVFVCHQKKIKGYNTIRDIWIDEYRTRMKIYCKNWVAINPLIPVKRCLQGWMYFKNIKRAD